MDPSPRPVRSWLLVVAGAVVASLALGLLSLPSPGAVRRSARRPSARADLARELELPPLLFRVGQGLVGAVIGALVRLPALGRIAADWPSVLLVTLGTLGISLAAGRLLALHRDVSR
jgi:uncharacterized protein